VREAQHLAVQVDELLRRVRAKEARGGWSHVHGRQSPDSISIQYERLLRRTLRILGDRRGQFCVRRTNRVSQSDGEQVIEPGVRSWPAEQRIHEAAPTARRPAHTRAVEQDPSRSGDALDKRANKRQQAKYWRAPSLDCKEPPMIGRAKWASRPVNRARARVPRTGAPSSGSQTCRAVERIVNSHPRRANPHHPELNAGHRGASAEHAGIGLESTKKRMFGSTVPGSTRRTDRT